MFPHVVKQSIDGGKTWEVVPGTEHEAHDSFSEAAKKATGLLIEGATDDSARTVEFDTETEKPTEPLARLLVNHAQGKTSKEIK